MSHFKALHSQSRAPLDVFRQEAPSQLSSKALSIASRVSFRFVRTLFCKFSYLLRFAQVWIKLAQAISRTAASVFPAHFLTPQILFHTRS